MFKQKRKRRANLIQFAQLDQYWRGISFLDRNTQLRCGAFISHCWCIDNWDWAEHQLYSIHIRVWWGVLVLPRMPNGWMGAHFFRLRLYFGNINCVLMIYYRELCRAQQSFLCCLCSGCCVPKHTPIYKVVVKPLPFFTLALKVHLNMHHAASISIQSLTLILLVVQPFINQP